MMRYGKGQGVVAKEAFHTSAYWKKMSKVWIGFEFEWEKMKRESSYLALERHCVHNNCVHIVKDHTSIRKILCSTI